MKIRAYLFFCAWFLTGMAVSQTHVNSASVVEAAIDKELARLGLTSEKLERLKSIGLDLRTAWIRHERATELSQAAVADEVFIGEALRTENAPAPRDYPFHSRVLVRVIEPLKGSLAAGDTIKFLKQSGPLSGGSLSLQVSDELEIKNGERAVFFAQIPSRNSYLTSVHKRYFADGRINIQASEYWVDVYTVHKIKLDKVEFRGIQKDLDEVARNVRRVAKALR